MVKTMTNIIVNKKHIDIIQNAKKIYPSLENLNVKPSGVKQIFNHPNSYGYDEVIVEEVASDTLNVIPTIEQQTFNGLFGTVNVEGLKVPIEQWYVKEVETWT